MLTYRPGGPLDLVVGLTTLGPIAIAIAGVIWPPVARGDRSFSAIMWLGIGGLLCLVPLIVGLVDQLTAYGSKTLMPLGGGGLSLADRPGRDEPVRRDRRRPAAARRKRRVAGGSSLASRSGSSTGGRARFSAGRRSRTTSRCATWGARSRFDRPPALTSAVLRHGLATGTSARLRLDLTGTVDLRPIGSVELSGCAWVRLPLARLCRDDPAARPVRVRTARRSSGCEPQPGNRSRPAGSRRICSTSGFADRLDR
jgi:hypothetical protein